MRIEAVTHAGIAIEARIEAVTPAGIAIEARIDAVARPRVVPE